MNPNEIAVMFAHPRDAQVILENDNVMSDTLVISTLFPEGEVVIAPRDEFLKWLAGESNGEDV